LFDRIEFGVKLGKEQSGRTTLLAARFERGLDSGEIGLVEEEAANTAIDPVLGTLEVLALRIKACLLGIPSFCEDYGHTLEETSLRVPLFEVERLWLAIRGDIYDNLGFELFPQCYYY
jgi:hypothetical protein